MADLSEWLFNEAYLQRSVLKAKAVAERYGLAKGTAMWLIRRDAWTELKEGQDFMTTIELDMKTGHPIRFMGLPVRITMDGAGDTPMIQIVMEAVIEP